MTTSEEARLLEARTLVDELLDLQADVHAASDTGLLETHISWVLLAGDYAYKIKKPLNLGFLDFRELERRRHFCKEELRLNRQWAPSLYLDVVPITRHHGRARFGGDGTVLEYAVRMRRFDQDQLLDAQLAAQRLTIDDLRDLAGRVAGWHAAARPTPATRRAQTLRRTSELIIENFAPIEQALTGAARSADAEVSRDTAEAITGLRAWTDQQIESLPDTFAARFDNGDYRECHGDLHLRNLVRLADGITAFDCIEFDPQLRDIDVVADYAFLLMDLVARNQTRLAWAFFNRYLEVSGDYDGVRVYNLYFVYRCLVRAKIAVFRAAERRQREERLADFDKAQRYIDIALRQCAPRTPVLIALHGLTGAGKSYVAERIMTALPALRVRSDLERKRIGGLAETASSGSSIGTDLYDRATSDRVYRRLFDVAQTMLGAGHDVILDAAFLERGRRDDARALAGRCNARFVLLDVTAGEEQLRQRVARRQALGDDASEAGLQVLEHQLTHQEALAEHERETLLSCRSDGLDVARLVNRLRATQ